MTEPDPLENIEFSRDAVAEVQSLSSSDRMRLASGLRDALAKFKQGGSLAVQLEGTDYFSIPVAGGSVIAREIPGSNGFIVASVRDMQSLPTAKNQADAIGEQVSEASQVHASSPSQVAEAQVQEAVTQSEAIAQAEVQDTAKAQDAVQVQANTVAEAAAQVQEAVAKFQAILEAQEAAKAQEAASIKKAIETLRTPVQKSEETALGQEEAQAQQ